MTETEKITVGGLVSVLALIVPGFLIHSAPRFPGSLAGSMFGISAALLFVLLLSYTVVKRQPRIKERMKGSISLGALMGFHVYAGAIGALLGIIHSGHKFQSPLGVSLVISMLAVVASGFIGRYYLAQVSQDLRLQQKELKLLRDRYDGLATVSVVWTRESVIDPSGLSLDHLLGAISDLEFTIMARDAIKRTLARWTVFHVAVAIVMYGLMALHIWGGYYYGLRWLP